LHQHEREDEAWFVLQGRMRVWVGDAEIDAEPGSFVLAPRGVPHTFAREPGSDFKLLLLIAPAGWSGCSTKSRACPNRSNRTRLCSGR
jgi:mannose-6-phosphate isomerase-like protein (cupin superfamily)